MRLLHARRAGWWLVAALVLAGCGGAPNFPILATVAPATVPSDSVLTRTIEVTVTSASDADVTVTGGAVFSPYFERLDATEIGVVLSPGTSATFSLPLGVVTCPAGDGPSSAQVVLAVDGAEQLQTVFLEDTELALINQEMCSLIGGEDAG